jgi:hypothetical protein
MKMKIIVSLILILALFYPLGFSNAQTNERRAIWYHAIGDSEVLPNNYTLASIKIYNDFKLYSSSKYKIYDVFVLTGSTENVIYNTNISGLNRYFDFDALGLICQIAQQFNISVHAWLDLRAFNKPEWQTQDINNNTSPIVNFAIPDVQKRILDIVNEIIQNYPVKGIQLDYIRYAGKDYSYDNYSITTFQSLYGFDPRTDPNNSSWVEWREQQITNMVNETYILVKSHNLTLELSCDVFPRDSENLYQNWFYWSKIPIVDFLCPMSYEINPDTFKSDAEYISKNVDPRIPILMGIGIWQINDPSVILDEINIARQYNYGFAFFRDKWLDRIVPSIPDISNPISPSTTYWYQDPKIFGVIIILIVVGIMVLKEMAK